MPQIMVFHNLRDRCFMISILGNYNYKFPKPIKLQKKLKDIINYNVDEKYYLTPNQVECILRWNAQQEPFDTLGKEIAPTLTTRSGAFAAGMILTTDLTDSQQEKQIGQELLKLKKGGESNIIQFIKNGSIKIRKLTPNECFRLMGVSNSDFNNIQPNQSDNSLYHLAGDSIATTCLMGLFGELLGLDYHYFIYKATF